MGAFHERRAPARRPVKKVYGVTVEKWMHPSAAGSLIQVNARYRSCAAIEQKDERPIYIYKASF